MANNFRAEVKESGEGQSWIFINPYEDIGLKQNQNITIRFPDGTPIKVVEEFANQLHDQACSFKISTF